jgi:hypothetical protein
VVPWPHTTFSPPVISFAQWTPSGDVTSSSASVSTKNTLFDGQSPSCMIRIPFQSIGAVLPALIWLSDWKRT